MKAYFSSRSVWQWTPFPIQLPILREKWLKRQAFPPEINVLLSLGLGITATKVAGKYITVSKADRLRIDRWKYRVY
jgi:hypothetical protein